MKLLIIEDNEETLLIIKDMFKKTFEISTAKNGKQALKYASLEKPDIILLDISLPDASGFDICKNIVNNKKKYGTPNIIMLTSHSNQDDVIKGLEIGATDYIKKPFNEKELFLRVNKFTHNNNHFENYLYYYNIKIDIENQIVFWGENEISITRKEYDLLLFLIRNKGLIVSRNKIINYVWPNSFDTEENAINQCVKRLRKKLPLLHEHLETKRGFGYRLKS